MTVSSGNASRARKLLNYDTITAMHKAFLRGGKTAIREVMKDNPATFLKLLVLLVPRELEVTHSEGVKAMSDEQIEAAISIIKDMIAERNGAGAKVVEAVALPVPPVAPITRKASRPETFNDPDEPGDGGLGMGEAPIKANS